MGKYPDKSRVLAVRSPIFVPVNQVAEQGTEERVSITKKEYDHLKEVAQRYEDIKHQLAELKRLIFGSRSEKYVGSDDSQLALFEQQAGQPVEQREEISYSRRKGVDKAQPVRTELPAHLPRLTEVIEPHPIPQGAQKIGEEISESLEYKPASIYVRQVIRPKYAIKDQGIICAVMPTMPIPRSNAGASLLAHLIVSKFVDHLPFYRQSRMFNRQGVHLAESTISGWFAKSCELLEPLYHTLKRELLSSGYIQADETPIRVLDPKKNKTTHRGYHWVYHDPVNHLVVFDYQKSRYRAGPENFLGNFHGIIQTDGYKVYDELKIKDQIIHAGCMAHMRRYFFEAKDSDPDRANHVLELIKVLYMMEQFSMEKNHNDEEKLFQRNSALKVLNRIKDYIDQEIIKVRPKSPIGIAMAYALRQWPKILVYTDHPQMLIDNNLIENTIRPVALGRKNYLFAGSHDGARRAAIIYSFLGTCKLNDVNPFEWLTHVLSVIPDCKTSQLKTLLPQYCKIEEQYQVKQHA